MRTPLPSIMVLYSDLILKCPGTNKTQDGPQLSSLLKVIWIIQGLLVVLGSMLRDVIGRTSNEDASV